MSGRPPSGVASLRARFEQNTTSESPTPSRGRSPAGSFTSDTSRPLSKVRASFISVGEPSGQMSNLAEDTIVGAPVAGDGAQLSKSEEPSRLNGAGPTSTPKETAAESLKVKADQADAESSKEPSEKQDQGTTANEGPTTGLRKTRTGVPDDAASSQLSASKGEAGSADSGLGAKDVPNLGSILKGSAFEKEEAKMATASQKPAQAGAAKTTGKTASGPKTSTIPAVTKPAETPVENEKVATGKIAGGPKTSTVPAATGPAETPIEKEQVANGKAKESRAAETNSQPKAQTEQSAPTKTGTAPKSEPVAAAKSAAKEAETKSQPKAQTEQSAPNKTQTAPKPEPVTKEAERKLQPKAQTEQSAPTKTQTAPKPEPVAAAKPVAKEAETKSQQKAQTEQQAPTKTQTAPKPGSVAAAKPVTREAEKKESTTSAPPAAAASKDKTTQPTASPTTLPGSKTASTAKKEDSPEKHEPEPAKETPKAPVATTKPPAARTDHKNDGPSAASKPATAKPALSAAPTATKPPPKNTTSQKPTPPSGAGFTKPKPRSPTRPVKLPAHLVAQTAASAAKHGDESHTEPHKDASTVGSKASNPKSPVHSAPQQRKPPRMSMPATASSKPLEKEKPKPRMSIAGGSTGGGSFLERMMRPTQSSAQKTHEKVDPAKNSPPRKLSGSRNVSGVGPKTVTGASTHKSDEHAHNDSGHGQGREKHGGPTKSEIEHGEGQEATVAPDSNVPVDPKKLSAAGIADENRKD